MGFLVTFASCRGRRTLLFLFVVVVLSPFVFQLAIFSRWLWQDSSQVLFPAGVDNSKLLELRGKLKKIEDKMLLELVDREWTPDTMSDRIKLVDQEKLRDAVSNVEVQIPGVDDQKFNVPFFNNPPSWLAARTFTSRIFFCPPNGHEGTITHLIGQLLRLGMQQKSSHGSAGDVIGSFMDVGSNLGFYSLLAIDMGVPAYAFDIQPFCLYNLHSLAQTSPQRRHLHLFNVGMADAPQVVVNAEGGCDFENFYVSDRGASQNVAFFWSSLIFESWSAGPGGKGVQVPVVRLDDWIRKMKGEIPLPIRVLKMDTEGAEGRIVLGMHDTLAAPCTLLNWIVELTPAHWYRFGQSMEDQAAVQAYIDVVEKYNYKAYLMYMPAERRPPSSLHDFMKPLSAHPGMPGQADTGCEGAPYYEILDMQRFFHDYCTTFLEGVIRHGKSSKGYCGNIWFAKQGCPSA